MNELEKAWTASTDCMRRSARCRTPTHEPTGGRREELAKALRQELSSGADGYAAPLMSSSRGEVGANGSSAAGRGP